MAQKAPAALVPLHDAGNELALRKPSWRRGLYELRAGDELDGRRYDLRASRRPSTAASAGYRP